MTKKTPHFNHTAKVFSEAVSCLNVLLERIGNSNYFGKKEKNLELNL